MKIIDVSKIREIKKQKLSTLALIFSALLGSSTFAASSGTLTLQGTVAAINDLTVTPNGSNNTTLNLISGESGKMVATVSESSNNLTGYSIQISSTNGSELRLGADPSKKTTYTLKYGAGSYQTIGTTPIAVKTVSNLASLTTVNSDILINVVAVPNALQGTYTDNLNLAIVAN